MNTKELTEEALKLPKKEKNALINALLQSMSTKAKTEGKTSMPVYNGLLEFADMYKRLKHTDYSDSFSKADFRYMKSLLEKLNAKIVAHYDDPTITAATSDELMNHLDAFMLAVASMPNKWYFDNRFTIQTLATDFDKIYGQLTNVNGYDRAKRAIDCL